MAERTYPTDDDERVLRMEELQVRIEKGRLEMARIQQEIRADSRKFMARAGLTVAALVSAGIAAGAYLGPQRRAPTPPQVIIIQAPPGTTATVVPSAPHK